MMKACAKDQRDSSGENRGGAAFTLVEIMVTVVLLSAIIIFLVQMFSQTRRAFTSSIAQVDVLEAGRAASDLIVRDLEQIAPTYYQGAPNFYLITSVNYVSLVNQLANPTDLWTNVVQELLFLTPNPPYTGQWNAIGYRLQTSDEQGSVGSLYRYYVPGLTITNITAASNITNVLSGFIGTSPLATATNFNRIIDGVTYFRVLAYKTNGVLITNGNYNLLNSPKTIQVRLGDYPGLDYMYSFTSNATPAYVEFEMGILETQALEQYRAFGPGTQAADNYLIEHPGFVHIFRQRVPIRDVDPTTLFQ